MSENEARIAALGIWSGPARIEPLSGGISNLSYTVTDRTGKYVVRLTRDFPFHHVFRDREVMSARAAHAAGFAPEIVHAAPGLMVSRFIDGRVLTSADLRANIPRIAEFLRRFHTEMPEGISGPGYIFWVFHTNRDYVRMLRAEGRAHDAERWLAINAELEAAQIPLPIRFGHHDLLPANLMDDGRRLWLIDYEYAGFDTAMFDLANLSSNNGFSPAQSEALLAEYFGVSPSRDLLRAHAAMEAASLLREALWSLVSVTQLDAPGVDYQTYADENFVKLDTALAAYRQTFGA
jgi:thiamine kinase-like enzyme